jgi:hypothetical protein
MSATIPFCAFVETVLHVRLTRPQEVLARVAFDRVEPRDLTGADRDIARQLFGSIDTVPPEARGVLVAVCGARGGKSYVLGALYALWRSLTADLGSLAPGEQASAVVVAPDVRLARQVLRYVTGAARAVPAIAACIESESSDSLLLRRPDGAAVALEVLPATRGGSAVRGRSLVCAVLDEAAFFRDADSVVNDSEIFKAIAPRVTPGGLVVIASTPWAEVGLLHSEFSANHGAPRTALAAHAPTLLLRDGDPGVEAMVRRERDRDPDNARREFDAEFMAAGSGLFFPPELLGPACDDTVSVEHGCPAGALAVIGGDLGLVHDASAFVAVHVADDLVVVADLCELRPARGTPLKLSDVVAAGCDFARRHGVREIHVDHHVLEPAREHLPSGFTLDACEGGQQAKADRHIAVREGLREGKVRIAGDLRRIVIQLGSIVSRPLPGGGIAISIPRRGGVHGDAAAATILAVHAALAGLGGGMWGDPDQAAAAFAVNAGFVSRFDTTGPLDDLFPGHSPGGRGLW